MSFDLPVLNVKLLQKQFEKMSKLMKGLFSKPSGNRKVAPNLWDLLAWVFDELNEILIDQIRHHRNLREVEYNNCMNFCFFRYYTICSSDSFTNLRFFFHEILCRICIDFQNREYEHYWTIMSYHFDFSKLRNIGEQICSSEFKVREIIGWST